MKHKPQLVRTLASWVILLVFMMVAQPDKLPVVLLIVPFVLLFVALLSTWQLLFGLWARYSSKQYDHDRGRRLGFTVCASLILLLILQSLGQLTLRDIATVAAIALLGYLYMARNRSAIRKG